MRCWELRDHVLACLLADRGERPGWASLWKVLEVSALRGAMFGFNFQ